MKHLLLVVFIILVGQGVAVSSDYYQSQHMIVEEYGTVVMVAGGVGTAPIFPIAREMKKAGNRVIVIQGARTKELLFWEEKIASICDEHIITTDDGSFGRKGLVTEPLKEVIEREKVAIVYAIWNFFN